jgi:hypothetical protein
VSTVSEGERDQQRLHGWPDWDTSVLEARARLAFDPAWTPAPGAKQSPDYLRWRHTVELRRLLAEGQRAVIQLHLPDRFRDYWLACFLAPYQRDGLAAIRDPVPSGDIMDKRVFPPPIALWFEAGIDASTAPAKLVIEGPAALASSALLRLAERRALDARRRAGFPKQHPLTRSRQIGPALENRARARAEPNPRREQAVRRARALCQRGEKASTIATTLGKSNYTVSVGTVRRWVKDLPSRGKGT